MTIKKYMNIEEFCAFGYLQEVNRQFFHPLGLALEVTRGNGNTCISGIWDCQNDPEGLMFDSVDTWKAQRVESLLAQKAPLRQKLFGAVIQPVFIENTGQNNHEQV